MKKYIISSIITLIIATGCNGQTIKQADMYATKNDTTSIEQTIKHVDMPSITKNTTYFVWSTLNLMRTNGTEQWYFAPNYGLIQSLPTPVKTIIARYTMFIPDYLLAGKTESKLARALGNFATLKEAQQTLLKNWNGENLTLLSGFPASLQFTETKESLTFECSSSYGDPIVQEFKIDKNGQVFYFPQPEPREKISYNRKTLVDEYACCYRFMLNGKPVVYFKSLFLDADNVQSVEVNKRDRIVYIEQKNKNPDYFVRSDIAYCLDSLAAFKVKSLDEIPLISIEDETTKDYFYEFTENDTIETSAIKGINSYVIEEYGTKGVVVALKK